MADEEAWSVIPSEQQQILYSLLPPPSGGAQSLPLDHSVHPFKTEYAPYIKHFLHEWQNDLREGRNTQKWRKDAELASGERAAGVFDDVLAKDREEKWGMMLEAGEPEDDKVDHGEKARDDKIEDEKIDQVHAETDLVSTMDQLPREEMTKPQNGAAGDDMMLEDVITEEESSFNDENTDDDEGIVDGKPEDEKMGGSED